MTAKTTFPENVAFKQLGADPAAVTGQVQVYSKPVLGVSQLFTRDGAGVVAQVGGGGGGGSTPYVFIFQPDGTPGDNVYDDFGALYTAYTAAKGQKLIEIDDSITSPAVIPAATYDLPDTSIVGNWSRRFTELSLAEGVVFTNFRRFATNIRVAGPTTAPISDLIGTNNRFIFDDCAYSYTGALIASAPTGKDTSVIEVRNGSKLFGTVPYTVQNGSGTLQVLIAGPNSEALGLHRGTGSLYVSVVGGLPTLGGGSSWPIQDIGSNQIITGAPSQLPVSFRAGDFFGGTTTCGQMFDVDTSGGAVSVINLRGPAGHPGEFIAFKKSDDNNALIINTGSSVTIDRIGTSYTMTTPRQSVLLLADGVDNWIVVATSEGGGTSGGSGGVERLAVDGAASIAYETTFISGAGTDLTLANGTRDGFIKKFVVTGGTGSITPANLADGNVLSYSVTPANVSFIWDATGVTWHVYGNPLNMVTT